MYQPTAYFNQSTATTFNQNLNSESLQVYLNVELQDSYEIDSKLIINLANPTSVSNVGVISNPIFNNTFGSLDLTSSSLDINWQMRNYDDSQWTVLLYGIPKQNDGYIFQNTSNSNESMYKIVNGNIQISRGVVNITIVSSSVLEIINPGLYQSPTMVCIQRSVGSTRANFSFLNDNFNQIYSGSTGLATINDTDYIFQYNFKKLGVWYRRLSIEEIQSASAAMIGNSYPQGYNPYPYDWCLNYEIVAQSNQATEFYYIPCDDINYITASLSASEERQVCISKFSDISKNKVFGSITFLSPCTGSI